jgi:hypothetical protein
MLFILSARIIFSFQPRRHLQCCTKLDEKPWRQAAAYRWRLAAGQDDESTPHLPTLGQLMGGILSAAPEPLTLTAPGAEMMRFTLPERQDEHDTGDWLAVFLTNTSLTDPQSSHLYSYIGIFSPLFC